MTTPDGSAAPPLVLKATIEAADRAAARGAPGQCCGCSSMCHHDHTCPQCGEAWSHLDEPCRDTAAPMVWRGPAPRE